MEVKTAIKWARYYWLGAILQISIVSLVIVILRLRQIQYGMGLQGLFLAIGGLSSMLWGALISRKSKKILSYGQLVKDFFNIKQEPRLYILAFVFLGILFGKQLILGEYLNGVTLASFLILFIQAILFGGVEEVGWRYTFQPLLEKRFTFEQSCMITFVSWSIWHYMYFYITDSIKQIEHISFLIGLLGSCFILGALYRRGKSLWICVMYHALLNMFSQNLISQTLINTIVTNSICIVLAIMLARNKIIKVSKKEVPVSK